MAGHSKWANIKHRKAAQDAKRGKVYTKIRRKLAIAAKKGGPDPQENSALRLVMSEARAANMSKDTVLRTINAACGANSDDDNLQEIRYEGYGPGGVAVLVECLTDNRNRTVSEVRHAFTKCGGNLGTDGSVAYLFNKIGLLYFPAGMSEDKIMEIALEQGAQDVTTHDDGSIEVTTTVDTFSDIKEAFEAANIVPERAEVTMVASTSIALEAEDAEKMIKLNDMLEELDDVQDVYNNAHISDELLEKFGQ